MRRPVVLAAAAVIFFVASQATANPRLNYGQNLNAAQCTPGATDKMVLNIVYQVVNDADSGFGGYWAIDGYTKHVQVWDQGGGMFCVIAKYDGSFVTVGGTSPSGGGTVSAGVTGTIEGGYNATITGATFTPGTARTKGNIGTKDYACTITAGAAQCGPIFDWVGAYFSGAGLDFEYAGSFQWGWIYHAGDNGTWVNANGNSSGDITGS